MARSDFNMIPIHYTFTVNTPSVTKKFPIEGTQTPLDDAYLLLQIKSVSAQGHQIRINGTHLGGMDIPAAPGNSNAWPAEHYLAWPLSDRQ